jgi:hypothetical protein
MGFASLYPSCESVARLAHRERITTQIEYPKRNRRDFSRRLFSVTNLIWLS